MLYILAFTHNFLSFLMLHDIRRCIGVARFDKLGDARASTRGTSDRTGSTSFSYVLVSGFRQQGSRLILLFTELE